MLDINYEALQARAKHFHSSACPRQVQYFLILGEWISQSTCPTGQVEFMAIFFHRVLRFPTLDH